jgi:extracellular factor (EF) 3-hydroxypalmitic acid methyl ester biosynthesis protein
VGVNDIGSPSPPSSLAGDPGPVAAVRCLLDELSALIEQIEASVERGTRGSLPRLIADNDAITQRIMEGIGTILHEVGTSGDPPEVADQIRELVVSRLAAWSSTSPVFYHVRNTPREDFNNFEIAMLLLENRLAGGDAAAQMLDRYYLSMVTSGSFRIRFTSIADRLVEETERRAAKARPVRILNLHTNTGRELELLAKNRDFVRTVQITCLDRDPVALRRARQRLERFEGRSQYVLADARKYAASRTWPDAPYDIIYTVNLFDQLDDEQTAKLISDCRRGLTPGGTLMFGNYAPSLPNAERALIAWLMNWNIRCRSAEDWRRIFAQTWLDAECVLFEPDELEASNLVIATRP